MELYSRSNYVDLTYPLDIENTDYYKFVAIHTLAQYNGFVFTNFKGEVESTQHTLDFFPVANENITEVASLIDHIEL